VRLRAGVIGRSAASTRARRKTDSLELERQRGITNQSPRGVSPSGALVAPTASEPPATPTFIDEVETGAERPGKGPVL